MKPSLRPGDTAPVLFPAFRSYLEARRTVNNDLMALVVGAGLASDRLGTEPPEQLLATQLPTIRHAERMNQKVSQVICLLDQAEATVARTAVPYVVSMYGVYLADAIQLLQGTGQDEDQHEPDDTHLASLHERFETAAGIELPSREIALFEVIRMIRNRLAHQGGTPGSKLASQWRYLSGDAKGEWVRIAGRPLPEVLPEHQSPMALGLGELFAVLAVTHRLAHQINAGLQQSVGREVWADMAVKDYRDLWPRRFGDASRCLSRISGYAESFYSPLKLDREELEGAAKRVGALYR